MNDDSQEFKVASCPLRGHWTSFRLVDEHGEGRPYAGLVYRLIDRQNQEYTGMLDAEGYAKVENFYCGPALLDLSKAYNGSVDPWYEKLKLRDAFPLPLSALQVAAEQSP
ncbi:lipase family protein, partial [Pseudomonas sp. D47]